MKFIKKNLSTIVGILVFIIVLTGIFTVKKVFTNDETTAIYGTRLEGREDVKITKETKDKVADKLADSASDISVRIAGRIVNIHFKVNTETKLADAKDLGKKALGEFSKAEKEYYDFQILVENDKNTNQFPIIGYKHHKKENITWTKDRAEN